MCKSIVNTCLLLAASLLHSAELVSADITRGQDSKKKPNVLVIFADDVGTGDVPGYWNSNKVNMPHLEDLVSKGTTFTDAHSSPLCAPSRYMFLSGNYQHRGVRYPSVWNLNYKTSQFKSEQISIAQVLRDEGYNTGMFGKWHLGGKVPLADNFETSKFYAKKDNVLRLYGHDWSKPMEEGPWDIGFQSSCITSGGIQSPPYAFIRNNTLDISPDDVIYWMEGNYSMPSGRSFIKSSGEGSKDWDSTAYNMILVSEFDDFLDNHLATRVDDPFFAYVALGAVHLPNSPPDEYSDGTQVAGMYGTKHMDVLYEMDKVVGSLVEALDERRLLEDTIIVFTSDNGGLSPETFSDQYGHRSNGRLRGYKGELYEGGIRVPMTFRWDNGGIPRGQTRSNLIGLNDLYKTITGLVGVDVPEGQAKDSIDFSRYILNSADNENLREYYGAWIYDFSRLMVETMRHNEMKLVRSYQNSTVELYNLTADIGERHDLSEIHPEIVNSLFRELRKIGACHDRPGKFYAKTKGNKMKSVSCYWYGKKRTRQRCKKFPEGKENCHKTCAGSNSQYCAKDFYSQEKLFKIFQNTY